MDELWTSVISNVNIWGNSFEPYKAEIRNTALLLWVLNLLNQVIICDSMRKYQSVNGHSITQFVAASVQATLGFSINDKGQAKAAGFLLLVQCSFVGIYLYFANSEERSTAMFQVNSRFAALLAITAYILIEDSEVVLFRFQLIETALLLLPYLNSIDVIREKSTTSLFLSMSLLNTPLAFLWFLYTATEHNDISTIQHGLVFLMEFVQLSLFAVYAPQSKYSEGTEKEFEIFEKN